jgi:hypothetical protein
LLDGVNPHREPDAEDIIEIEPLIRR